MSASSATFTDAELLELARSGDRPAFDELLLRHDERMRGLAFRLLADREGMDDALYAAYLEAYKGMPGLRPDKDFGQWLYRLTYNACIDEIRRRGRQPEQRPTRPSRPRTGAPPRSSEGPWPSCPPSQRVTVVLVDGEGFEHSEVADILGVAPGTVSSRLYRARTKLRRLLWDEVR